MEKKKIRLGKKILIVILVILAIFIVLQLRKVIIINSLQSKAKNYMEIDNYKAVVHQYQGDNMQTYTTYKSNGKSLSILKAYSTEDIRTLINYKDKEIAHTFIEAGGEKVVILKGNNIPAPIEISNGLNTENLWQFIIATIFSKIESEECNGKQCYKIEVSYSPNILYDDGTDVATIYLDKETGLKVREINGTIKMDENKINIITDYEYEFNNVDDTMLIEPDISQYKLQENEQ